MKKISQQPSPAIFRWQNYAECSQYDPEWWFPLTKNKLLPDEISPTQTAINICQQCPVKAMCANYVLEQWDTDKPIRYGIWAGVDINPTYGSLSYRNVPSMDIQQQLQQAAKTGQKC